jgi:hypothetical protein
VTFFINLMTDILAALTSLAILVLRPLLRPSGARYSRPGSVHQKIKRPLKDDPEDLHSGSAISARDGLDAAKGGTQIVAGDVVFALGLSNIPAKFQIGPNDRCLWHETVEPPSLAIVRLCGVKRTRSAHFEFFRLVTLNGLSTRRSIMPNREARG